MAKDKQFEPLKGSEGYDVWTSRMENLAKRKGLGALMHFGNDYANAMCDGDVDRFNGTDVDDETVNGEGELPTMSTARKAKEVGFETPRRQSKYGRKSFTTCRTIASSDNDRLHGLIIEKNKGTIENSISEVVLVSRINGCDPPTVEQVNSKPWKTPSQAAHWTTRAPLTDEEKEANSSTWNMQGQYPLVWARYTMLG